MLESIHQGFNDIANNEPSQNEVQAAYSAGTTTYQPINMMNVGYNPSTTQGVQEDAGRVMSFINGFMDSAATSIRSAYALYQKDSAYDSSYNPFNDPQVKGLGSEFALQYKDFLMDSPNPQYTMDMIETLQKKQVDQALYANHPYIHLAGELAGGLADPIFFTPLLGIGRAAVAVAANYSKLAGVGVAGLEGGLIGGAFAKAQSEYDPTVDSGSIAEQAAIGLLLGSTMGAFSALQDTRSWLPKTFNKPELGVQFDTRDAADYNIHVDPFEGITSKPEVPAQTTDSSEIPSPTPEPVLNTEPGSSVPADPVNSPEALSLASQIVNLRNEWTKHELNYRRTKDATGATSSDLNPYGKLAGQTNNKVKALMKQYEAITGVSFDGIIK